jgi:hypothetical protein
MAAVREHRYDPQSPRGRLGGRVVDPHDRPVPEAQVGIASGPSHKDIAAVTGSDGKFDFGDVLAGDYTLRVQAQDFEPQTAAVAVRAGMRANATIRLSIRSQESPGPSPGGQHWEANEAPADANEQDEE